MNLPKWEKRIKQERQKMYAFEIKKPFFEDQTVLEMFTYCGRMGVGRCRFRHNYHAQACTKRENVKGR